MTAGGTPTRRGRLPVTVLVVAFVAALAAAPAEAQKKRKGPGSVNITQTGGPIPDRGPGATGIFGQLVSTINVGKQFKGRRIRDVNVTVQLTGLGPSPNSLEDIRILLTAPNGATSELVLVGDLFPGNLAGPLTLDDETPLFIATSAISFGDPDALLAPYQGVAQTAGVPLANLDNGRVPGAWTLRAVDTVATATSTLNSWRLNVVAGRPFRTK
jgi:subtilisin-like proprotein convertase family protein